MNPTAGEAWTETKTGQRMVVHATHTHAPKHAHLDHVALAPEHDKPATRWIFLAKFLRTWTLGALLLLVAGCATAPVELHPGQRLVIPPDDAADERTREEMGAVECPQCGEWRHESFTDCRGCE